MRARDPPLRSVVYWAAMRIASFFFYFFCFFPGAVCIVLSGISWAKTRDGLIRTHLFLFVPITLALLISVFEYFAMAARMDYPDALSVVLIELRAAIRSPVFYLIPLLFHGLVDEPMPKTARAAFLTLVPLAALSPLAVLLITGSERAMVKFYVIAFPYFFYASIVYSLILLFLRRARLDKPERRLLIRGFILICAPMVPILAFQYVNMHVLRMVPLKFSPYLDYLFYGAWSVFYSWYLIKTVFLRAEGGARDGVKYRKSRISRAEAERCRSIIDELMERESPHRNPDFSLDRLASRSGISRNRLSQVLNESYGTSFYDFVNAYRIRDAKRLLADPRCGFSVLEIAFEAGFNSKTSFYAAFKKLEKMYPAEFRKRSAAEPAASSG